jgi:hypothetical protein
MPDAQFFYFVGIRVGRVPAYIVAKVFQVDGQPGKGIEVAISRKVGKKDFCTGLQLCQFFRSSTIVRLTHESFGFGAQD